MDLCRILDELAHVVHDLAASALHLLGMLQHGLRMH